jgi:hypothetical protein
MYLFSFVTSQSLMTADGTTVDLRPRFLNVRRQPSCSDILYALKSAQNSEVVLMNQQYLEIKVDRLRGWRV